MASLSEIQALVQQIKNDLPLLVQRSQIAPTQVVIGEGLSDLSNRLGLIQAGEFRAGNGIEPGFGFSGMRIGYPAFSYDSDTWNLVGIDNDTLQVGIRASDGKFLAGGGDVIIDEDGVRFTSGAGDVNSIIWVDPVNGDVEGRIKLDANADFIIDPDGDTNIQSSVYSTASDNALFGVNERATAPAYEDNYALLYFLDTGKLMVRHKQSTTEIETALVNASGGYDAPSGSASTFGSIQVDSILNDTGLAHGTFTPELTNDVNVSDSSVPRAWRYVRIGDQVIASGPLSITPTASNSTTVLLISLPIASNFTDANDLSGNATEQAHDTAANVVADTTEDTMRLVFQAPATTALPFKAVVMYDVL